MTDATLRPYASADAPALARLLRASVLRLGPAAYSQEQVCAWARYPESLEAFANQLAAGTTLVAEVAGEPAAFAQLHPTDHVALLYCSPDFARQGLGTRLVEMLEGHARAAGVPRLRVEASRLARPLFERAGFVVVEVEHPVRHGVSFERFRMEKSLPSATSDSSGPPASANLPA